LVRIDMQGTNVMHEVAEIPAPERVVNPDVAADRTLFAFSEVGKLL